MSANCFVFWYNCIPDPLLGLRPWTPSDLLSYNPQMTQLKITRAAIVSRHGLHCKSFNVIKYYYYYDDFVVILSLLCV